MTAMGSFYIFRRHSKDCPHKPKGRAYRQCKCPIWVGGSYRGERIDRSLKTNIWTKAAAEVRDMEMGLAPVEKAPPAASVRQTAEEYIRDCEARKLVPAVLKKYRSRLIGFTGIHRDRQEHRSTEALVPWGERSGLATVADFTVERLTAYRYDWKDSATTSRKRLETLRSFFTWCQARGLITSNPAKALRMPKPDSMVTMPYTSVEILALLAACDFQHTSDRGNTQSNRRALRSLILVLRYTGLRIGDAMRLGEQHIQEGKIVLRTQKTGQPIMVPVSASIIAELRATPKRGAGWFWDGDADLESTIEDWRRRLKAAAQRARVPRPSFHRFRDTFATELLASGAAIEHVAELLGHSSVKVTHRHYSPWVAARQAALEADVLRAMASDPLVPYHALTDSTIQLTPAAAPLGDLNHA
jgi:integrase/recombinase XerD